MSESWGIRLHGLPSCPACKAVPIVTRYGDVFDVLWTHEVACRMTDEQANDLARKMSHALVPPKQKPRR